jgi:hypothetical protein
MFFLGVSCENVTTILDDKKELYEKTDSFVSSLQTTYQSYGIFGGINHTTITSDGLYEIQPIGRLINVRIEKVVDNSEYEDLVKDLESHYSGDSRVNDIYICGSGTIMIDCRN